MDIMGAETPAGSHSFAGGMVPRGVPPVVLVDPALKPVGLVPLSRIMGSGRDRLLRDLQRDQMETIEVEEPQADEPASPKKK